MGEVADMILDGALCESCGGYVGDEVGSPRQCGDCAVDSLSCGQAMRFDGLGAFQNVTPINRSALDRTRDGFVTDPLGNRLYRPNKTNCPECGKIIKRTGAEDHLRVVHGIYLRTRCPQCGKSVKTDGLGDHMRDVHGIQPVEA